MAIVFGGFQKPVKIANLGAALVRAASLEESGDICYVGHNGEEFRQSYSQLLDDASRMLGGLRAMGLRAGDRVILQLPEEPDLLAAFWACVLGGIVAIPVATRTPDNDPQTPLRLREAVWQAFGRPAVVIGSEVGGLRTAEPDRGWHEAAWDDPAVLLLTSGSTGTPKAVTLTHGNILSRSAATAEVNGLSTGTRSFNWMPLDHVGGLVMFHARDVYVGATQVHARISWILAEPLRWLDAIDRHRATVTWAPNFAFGLVTDRADELTGRDWDLSCLGYIMNGGESIKPRIVRRFLTLLAPFGLPETAMFPGWGMSETSAGVVDCRFSLAETHDDDRFVAVGRPHPGVTIRVVDDRSAIVAEGVVGHLQASGAPITPGYADNPEQNRQSFTEDGWFKTGDLAFISGGVLTVTGRADDVIVVGGVAFHGHEIEAAVEELAFVEPTYTVACTVGEDDRLAIFFHPRGEFTDDAIRQLVLDRFGVEAAHIVAVARDEVPKTGIGKLRRTQLRERFEAHA